MKKLFIAATIATFTTYSIAARMSCPVVIETSPQTFEEHSQYLVDHSIMVKGSVELNNLNQFISEYKKFPAHLASEMKRKGTKIHIMEGNGITVDPTWIQEGHTIDGRNWDNVPGGAGTPGQTPTRITINQLYKKHGSINLFLHEHAHTMDRMFRENLFSHSNTWDKLINRNEVTHFLNQICGSYCVNNTIEGFAELFAYYYACEASKQDLKENLPDIAAFFDNLKSIRKFKRKEFMM